MFSVAITGNIGSGKSTFSQYLKEILTEFKFISVDAIVAELYASEKFCSQLKIKFGTCIKSEVSDLVFADDTARKWLEQMAASFVNRSINAARNHCERLLIEFPLLFENAAQTSYDHVITAYCDDATQMERVKNRDNFSEDKIKRIMGAQLSTDLKKVLADDAIDTNCTMQELNEKAFAVAAKIRVKTLKARFMEFFIRGEQQAAEQLWNAVENAYTEKHRFYHVLEHLAHMFYRYDQIKDKIKHPRIVELAIWFHDFVYFTDERYANNEAASVKAMYELFTKHMGGFCHTVSERGVYVLPGAAELILATKGHAIKSQYVLSKPDLKHDCEVFLDLDLSVLWSDVHSMNWFEAGVREEFKQYDDRAYAQGRIDAMSAFLKRDKVAQSALFAHQEPQARCSLQKIIDRQNFRAGYFQ